MVSEGVPGKEDKSLNSFKNILSQGLFVITIGSLVIVSEQLKEIHWAIEDTKEGIGWGNL